MVGNNTIMGIIQLVKNKSQADSSLVAQLKIILEPHEKTWSRKLDTTFDSKQ